LEEDGACLYHSREQGCTIPYLKSPVCAATYCCGLLEETSYAEDDVYIMLESILTNGFKPENEFDLDQSRRRKRDLLGYVEEITDEVKQLKEEKDEDD